MSYTSHDQTIHALKKEYPSLLHGVDFWIAQPARENSDEYLGDAFIAAWNVEDIEQPTEEELRGLIAKYQTAWGTAPKPAPNEISRRQFFQQLSVQEIITKAEALAAMQTGVIPAPLQAIIDTLPEANQFEAQMLVIGADTFNRAHPLTEVVRLALGWTEEQRDQVWRDAAKL